MVKMPFMRSAHPAKSSSNIRTNSLRISRRKLVACEGRQPKLSCTVAIEVIPSATAALTVRSKCAASQAWTKLGAAEFAALVPSISGRSPVASFTIYLTPRSCS
jgi:hypothetical protein